MLRNQDGFLEAGFHEEPLPIPATPGWEAVFFDNFAETIVVINHLQQAAVVVRGFHVDQPMQITPPSKNLFIGERGHIFPDFTVHVVHERRGEFEGFRVEPILALSNPVDDETGIAGMQQLAWSLLLIRNSGDYSGGSCHGLTPYLAGLSLLL